MKILNDLFLNRTRTKLICVHFCQNVYILGDKSLLRRCSTQVLLVFEYFIPCTCYWKVIYRNQKVIDISNASGCTCNYRVSHYQNVHDDGTMWEKTTVKSQIKSIYFTMIWCVVNSSRNMVKIKVDDSDSRPGGRQPIVWGREGVTHAC